LTYLLDLIEFVLLFGVVPNDLASIEVDIYSRIANSNKDLVEPHKEPTEQKHPVWHHPELTRNDGDAIVIQLALIQYYFFEK
jgi:hypothetical protein